MEDVMKTAVDSATKHTEAPWKIAHSGYANAPFVVYAGENQPQFANRNKYPLQGVNWIAEVKHDESEQYGEQIANVHIIATAPLLLEVLRDVAAMLPVAARLHP